MINVDTALSQNLLEVTIRDWIAHVKEHHMQDNTFRKLCPFRFSTPHLASLSTQWIDRDTVQQK